MTKAKVIIDTNFLLIPGQFKVDIFTEIEKIVNEPFELCIVEKTTEELQKIVMTAGRDDKFAAKLAQALVLQKGLKRLACSKALKSADDDIVELSDENTYVATQDLILRKRLKAKGAKLIGLRQKKYLAVME